MGFRVIARAHRADRDARWLVALVLFRICRRMFLLLKRKRVNKIVPPHVLMAQFFIERRNWLSEIAKATSALPLSFPLASFFIFPIASPAPFYPSCPSGSLASKAVPSIYLTLARSLAFSLEALSKERRFGVYWSPGRAPPFLRHKFTCAFHFVMALFTVP